ncbi:MAG: lysophospholipid acyltransferase family protein [Pseudomonadota bacterium]
MARARGRGDAGPARRGGLSERLFRALRTGPRLRAVAAWLGAVYIRFVTRTTRWERIGQDQQDRSIAAEGGLIAVMWHGRLFVSPIFAPPWRHTVAMISNSRDGDLIAAIVGHWGVETVRGSTYDRRKRQDKGGADAFAAAEAALREGALLAITPDGPRGPRMRAQPGAAQLAQRTGVPVLPIAFSVRRGWLLGSWDRFLLPAPFGRGVIITAEPLQPPAPEAGRDAAERFRLAIEQTLTALTEEADRRCGRPSVEAGAAEPGTPARPRLAPDDPRLAEQDESQPGIGLQSGSKDQTDAKRAARSAGRDEAASRA